MLNKKKKGRHEADAWTFDTEKRNSIHSKRNSKVGWTHSDRTALMGLRKGRKFYYFWMDKNDIKALRKLLDEYVDFFGDEK